MQANVTPLPDLKNVPEVNGASRAQDNHTHPVFPPTAAPTPSLAYDAITVIGQALRCGHPPIQPWGTHYTEQSPHLLGCDCSTETLVWKWRRKYDCDNYWISTAACIAVPQQSSTFVSPCRHCPQTLKRKNKYGVVSLD